MQAQKIGQGGAQLGAWNDRVHEAVLLQIFSSLEIVGKLLAQGLLNHPTPSETNQRLRFRQDQIAQHGETGGHTPPWWGG